MKSDVEVINKAITDEGIKKINEKLLTLYEGVVSGEIDYRKAQVATSDLKHLLQGRSLDWMYNRKIGKIKK